MNRKIEIILKLLILPIIIPLFLVGWILAYFGNKSKNRPSQNKTPVSQQNPVNNKNRLDST